MNTIGTGYERCLLLNTFNILEENKFYLVKIVHTTKVSRMCFAYVPFETYSSFNQDGRTSSSSI